MTPIMVATVSGLLAGTGSSATGTDGLFVDEQTAEVAEGLSRTESVGHGSTWLELERVVGSCGHDGWDGYGATAISGYSLTVAARLLFVLPIGVTAPTVSVDPDGEVSYEWYTSASRVLSVSVGADGMLHYAARVGASRHHGAEPFLGHFPTVILDLVRKVA